MNDDRQLDLFAQSARTAEVTLFPLHRQVGRARDVVNKLLVPGVRDIDAAYTRQTRRIFRDLVAAGVSEDDAHDELRAFTDVVNAEVWRRKGASRGGAL